MADGPIENLAPADGIYQLTIPAGAEVRIIAEAGAVLIGSASGGDTLTVRGYASNEVGCSCDHESLMHGFCPKHGEPPRWRNGVKTCDCEKRLLPKN